MSKLREKPFSQTFPQKNYLKKWQNVSKKDTETEVKKNNRRRGERGARAQSCELFVTCCTNNFGHMRRTLMPPTITIGERERGGGQGEWTKGVSNWGLGQTNQPTAQFCWVWWEWSAQLKFENFKKKAGAQYPNPHWDWGPWIGLEWNNAKPNWTWDSLHQLSYIAYMFVPN